MTGDLALRLALAAIASGAVTSLAVLFTPSISHRFGPETGHAAAASALLIALLLPIASATVPAWQTNILGTSAVAPSAAPTSAEVPLAGSEGTAAARRINVGLEAADQANVVPPAAARPPSGWSPAAWLLLFVWLVGFGAVGGRIALELRNLRRLWHNGSPLPAHVRNDTKRYATAVGLDTTPGVRLAPVASPLTWGVRGTVLLPHSSARWSQEDRRAAMLHEFAHIRRRDAAWLTLAQVCCALNWFNPAAWRLAREMRTQAELSTDALVVASGMARADYARRLLGLAGSMSAPAGNLRLAAVEGTGGLEGRIRALTGARPSRLRPWWHPVGWCTGVLLCLVPLLGARPADPSQVRAHGPLDALRALIHETAGPRAKADEALEPLWMGDPGDQLRVTLAEGTIFLRTSRDDRTRISARHADGSQEPLRFSDGWDEGRRDVTVTDLNGDPVRGGVVLSVELPPDIPVSAWVGQGDIDAVVESEVRLATVDGDVSATTPRSATIWVNEGNIEARVGFATGEPGRIVSQLGDVVLWVPPPVEPRPLTRDDGADGIGFPTASAMRVGDIDVFTGTGTITLHPDR